MVYVVHCSTSLLAPAIVATGSRSFLSHWPTQIGNAIQAGGGREQRSMPSSVARENGASQPTDKNVSE